MSTDVSELDAKTAKLGGVFDASELGVSFRDLLTDLVDSGNHLVDSLRQHMSAPWATRPLHVAFTACEELNAQATKGKDADYILITIGAVGKVYGTMYGMLSTPSFLPDVGNANEEKTPNELLTGGFPPMPLLGLYDGDEPVEFCLPVDQRRSTFAMHLSSIALHFLLYHEIGHIVAGHLELREHQGCAAAISEIGTPAPRNGTVTPLHVLEYDADAFAAHFESFIDLHPVSDGLGKEIFGWETVPEEDAGFIAHAVAISILFRMLGNDGFAPESLDPLTHPPPAVRSCLALSRTMSLAALAGRFEMDRFPQLCRNTIFHVEESWTALGLPGRRFGESLAWAEQVGRLSMELAREYESWNTGLCKFARVPTRWHSSWPSAQGLPTTQVDNVVG